MMAQLIVLLAEKPGLEVHVFVPGAVGVDSGNQAGGGGGGEAGRRSNRGSPTVAGPSLASGLTLGSRSRYH